MDWIWLALLVGLVICGSIAITYAGGSMDIPYGDDWSFSRAALTLGSEHRLELVPWGEPTLIGHLAWAYPFLVVIGDTQTALHWAVAVAGAIGLVATYLVMRHFLAPGLALFGTAVIAALPYYGVLLTTYMTDVTGFAAQMVCMAIGLAALRQPPERARLLLGVSLAVGLYSFTIRDIGIVAPFAVLAGHAIAARRDRRSLAPLAGALAAVVAVAAAFWVWRQGLPGDLQHQRPGFSTRSVFLLSESYFTVAFLALPALVLGTRRLWRRPPAPVLAVMAAALLIGLFVADWELRHDLPFNLTLIQVLFRSGEVPKAFLPTVLWAPLQVVVLLSGILLAGALATGAIWLLSRIRTPWSLDPGMAIMLAVGLLYAGALILRALQGEQIHARYMLGLMPSVVLAALVWGSEEWRARGWRRLGQGAVLGIAVLAALGVFVDKYFYGALWDAGESAAATTHVPSTRVDAGFAWVGENAKAVTEAPPSALWKQPLPWYSSVFPASGNCVIVSPDPLSGEGVRLVREVDFDAVPGLVRERFHVYRNDRSCGGI